MRNKLYAFATPQQIDIAALIGRMGIGAMMLSHGIPKIEKFREDPVAFMDFMGLGPEFSLGLTVFAEVGCSILIIFGLLTRLAVIPLIITMAVAIFMVHGDGPFAEQEMAVHYLLVYAMLLLLGSGRYSIDGVLAKKSAEKI